MLFLANIITLLFFATSGMAKDKFDLKALNEYLKVQKSFSQATCNSNVEQDFRDLDIKFRGDGNFIPVTLEQKIDQKTIKTQLPLIKEKIAWIKVQSEVLKRTANFEEVRQTLKRLENEVQILQEAKKDFFFAKKKDQKKDIEEKAKKQFEQVMKELDNLKNQAPYLLSFKFPLNHLELRADYEKFKSVAVKEFRARANSLYLARRILQDGSYDEFKS